MYKCVQNTKIPIFFGAPVPCSYVCLVLQPSTSPYLLKSSAPYKRDYIEELTKQLDEIQKVCCLKIVIMLSCQLTAVAYTIIAEAK